MAVKKMLYLSRRKPIKMNTNKPFQGISPKMDVGEVSVRSIEDVWFRKYRHTEQEIDSFLWSILGQKCTASVVVSDGILRDSEIAEAGKEIIVDKKYQPVDVLAGILEETAPLANHLYISMEGKSIWS